MNDTREFLEEQFNQASADEQSPDLQTNGEQITQPAVTEPVDLYLDAPKSYKKEYGEAFKELTPEMRKYLCERESETEKGFSRLNNSLAGYKWLDDDWQGIAEHAKQNGFNNPQDYYRYLNNISMALEKNPDQVLAAFNQAYGQGRSEENAPEKMVWQKISQMEEQFNSFNQHIQQNQESENIKVLNNFTTAKNEDGTPKYPHFEKARQVMGDLMNNGLAADLETAYEQAIWSIPEIRKELIAAEQHSQIKAAAREAEKAKNASFSLRSKTSPQNGGQMTTRQLLEKQFADMDE